MNIIDNFVCIDSRNRDVEINPSRYTYSITLDPVIRNVRSVSPKQLIIPISDSMPSICSSGPLAHTFLPIATTGSSAAVTADATAFASNSEELVLPYVILHLRDADPLTNYGTRAATAIFVYGTTVRTRPGRGYIILNPVMGENVTTGLPSILSRIDVSILGPNGTILDKQAKDNLHIHSVTLIRRGAYAQITTSEYFDPREIIAGDLVRFDRIKLDLSEIDPNVWTSGDVTSKQAFERFIGREEGHTVRELGSPTSAGTFRTFIISTDIGYDKKTGQITEGNYKKLWERIATLVVNQTGDEVLSETTTNAVTGGNGNCSTVSANIAMTASLVNLSLQTSLFMTIGSSSVFNSF